MMIKNKLHLAFLAFFIDVFMAFISYRYLTNFDQFKIYIVKYNFPPELELQVYKLFLQAIIFFFVLMIIFHGGIYFSYFKGKKFTLPYLKFYTCSAGISGIIMIFTGFPLVGLIATLIYLSIFYTVLKLPL